MLSVSNKLVRKNKLENDDILPTIFELAAVGE